MRSDWILQLKWRGLDFVYVPLRVKTRLFNNLSYGSETFRNINTQHDEHYLNKLCITQEVIY